MNLWLTLITQNREHDINELTNNISGVFDGIVAVVNQPSDDKTFDILESRKGKGKIIKRPFVRHHAFLMNEFLFSGTIKNLDWFMILDSSDRINPVWLKRLRDDIEHWDKNNVYGIYLDRIYLAKYFEGMEFFGGIHWGLGPIFGNSINISKITGYRKENFIINTRNKNPIISAVEHPVKYFVEYPNHSQVDLLYSQFGRDIYVKHMGDRLNFKIYIQEVLKIPCTVSALVDYISNGIKNKNLPDFIISYIEQEVNMKDLVRHYILKQSLEELSRNRFNWSFNKFYYNEIEHQNIDDGYVGVFNHYRIQKGMGME